MRGRGKGGSTGSFLQAHEFLIKQKKKIRNFSQESPYIKINLHFMYIFFIYLNRIF